MAYNLERPEDQVVTQSNQWNVVQSSFNLISRRSHPSVQTTRILTQFNQLVARLQQFDQQLAVLPTLQQGVAAMYLELSSLMQILSRTDTHQMGSALEQRVTAMNQELALLIENLSVTDTHQMGSVLKQEETGIQQGTALVRPGIRENDIHEIPTE